MGTDVTVASETTSEARRWIACERTILALPSTSMLRLVLNVSVTSSNLVLDILLFDSGDQFGLRLFSGEFCDTLSSLWISLCLIASRSVRISAASLLLAGPALRSLFSRLPARLLQFSSKFATLRSVRCSSERLSLISFSLDERMLNASSLASTSLSLLCLPRFLKYPFRFRVGCANLLCGR